MQVFSKTIIFTAAIIAAFVSSVTGQEPARITVDAVVTAASAQREAYINEFKNLLALETKVFEIYDKKGQVKNRRSVESTFIVYQSQRTDKSIAEFRNVTSVDGRKLDEADKRAQEFFEKIAKTDTSGKELEQIEREGSRFDQEISINGLTLFQAIVLADNIRPAFEFKMEGTESVNGLPVFVVSYRQVRDSPYVLNDPRRLAADGKPSLVYDVPAESKNGMGARVHGRFWIDAETFQVRKELRVLTVPKDGKFITAAETSLEYQTSPFRILTPQKLTFTVFRVDGDRGSRKDVGVSFTYSTFTKPDVEVKAADVSN